MKRELLSKLLRLSLVIVVVFVFATPRAFGAKQLKAPRLRAVAQTDGSVILILRLDKKTSKAANALVIQRKAETESAYTAIGTYSNPKIKQTIADTPRQGGLFSYQARVETSSSHSKWSKEERVTVSPPDSGDSPQTPPETPLAAGQSLCPAGTTEQVIQLVNAERAAAGVALLEEHPQLQWSARTHDIIMAASGVLSHDGWSSYIEQSGFNIGYAGENIAWGQHDATEVMNTWMNSPGHRANILSVDYKYIGVGCVIDALGAYWWVQNFGSLKEPCPSS